MASPNDKTIKNLESRIKDLEIEVRNNEIRNKRLKAELEATVASLLKTMGKKQQDEYAAIRKELKDKVDAERKQREEERKQRENERKEIQKQFKLTNDELKKLLR